MRTRTVFAAMAILAVSACNKAAPEPEPVVLAPTAEDIAAEKAIAAEKLAELTAKAASASTVAELGPLSIATSSFPELNKKVDEKLETLVRKKIDAAKTERDRYDLREMLSQMDSNSQLWKDVSAKIAELDKKFAK